MLSSTVCFDMVAELWGVMRGIAMVWQLVALSAAGGNSNVTGNGEIVLQYVALYSSWSLEAMGGLKTSQVARNGSLNVELYGKNPHEEEDGSRCDLRAVEPNDNKEDGCKADSYLQKMSKDGCKADSYLQKMSKDGCKAYLYLRSREVDEHYNKVVKNDFMTLSRSSVEYVFEICGCWTLAFLDKVYKVMSSQWMAVLLDYSVVVRTAVSVGNPTQEIVMHHMDFNNVDYFKNKLNYVMVNFGLVWQSNLHAWLCGGFLLLTRVFDICNGLDA